MSIKYRCKVKVRVTLDHVVEVDTDNPYGDAQEAALAALRCDPFIVATKASLEFISMDSEPLNEEKQE